MCSCNVQENNIEETCIDFSVKTESVPIIVDNTIQEQNDLNVSNNTKECYDKTENIIINVDEDDVNKENKNIDVEILNEVSDKSTRNLNNFNPLKDSNLIPKVFDDNISDVPNGNPIFDIKEIEEELMKRTKAATASAAAGQAPKASTVATDKNVKKRVPEKPPATKAPATTAKTKVAEKQQAGKTTGKAAEKSSTIKAPEKSPILKAAVKATPKVVEKSAAAKSAARSSLIQKLLEKSKEIERSNNRAIKEDAEDEYSTDRDTTSDESRSQILDESVDRNELWAKIDHGDLVFSQGKQKNARNEEAGDDTDNESQCTEENSLNIHQGRTNEVAWNTVNDCSLSFKTVVRHIIQDLIECKTFDSSSQFVNNPTNVKDLNGKEGNNDENSCAKTEQLIPVMEVTSNVKAPKPKPPLRRTFSVEGKSMERKNSRIFGSQELDRLNKKQMPVLNRKNSIESTNSSMKDLPKISEQPVNISQVEAKVNSIRKEPPKASIQEVTQRLYMKVKKKDVATDTGDLNKENRLAKLNAIKLKEFTRRAITAYKKRNKETQTYSAPVRYKDVTTDSYDLPFALSELKSVCVYTDNVDRKDASTSSMYTDPIYSIDHIDTLRNLINLQLQQVQQLPQQQACHYLHTTTTAGCRPVSPSQSINSTDEATNCCDGNKGNCDENSSTSDGNKQIRYCQQQQPQPFSFTKYITPQQNTPHVEISNPCTANPIYTSTVNINVSHNYINPNKNNNNNNKEPTTERTTSDCLSTINGKQNVLFPTPDLISNHNSADVNSSSPTTSIKNEENSSSPKSPMKVRYASTNVLANTENYADRIDNLTPDKADSCFASMTFSPEHDDKLTVDMTNVFAPEMCVLKDFHPDYCKPFKSKMPDQQKPNIVECSGDICEFSIRLQEPLLLKSIMKQQGENDCDIDNDNENSDSCDSIHYETTIDLPNNKKVHFPSKQNERMYNAMSNFMTEANELMSHLNLAANNLETKTQQQSYEFQINVNDIPKFVLPRKGKRRSRTTRSKSTDPSRRRSTLVDTGTDYNEMDTYENKYNSLVLDSCDRLEQRIQNVEQSKEKRNNYDELHRFPQPFSINSDWHQRNQQPLQQQDYSSLESNPTHSDYGSLPRRRHRTASRSPSAYLRHLTNLRQQIVETSREELLSNNQLNI